MKTQGLLAPGQGPGQGEGARGAEWKVGRSDVAIYPAHPAWWKDLGFRRAGLFLTLCQIFWVT